MSETVSNPASNPTTDLPGGTTGLFNPAPKPPGRHRFLDVFAGIGGFRFGFEPKWGQCVWSCEIDPYARRTYRANHDELETGIFPDIRQAGPRDVPDHEVLIAGFSCQSFSKAGISKLNSLGRPHGFRDRTRGTLFFEICRILAEHRPRAFLLENVPNLVNHDGGNTFRAVLDILEGELQYHVSTRVLDARPYVPQHRRRVFIAGHQEPGRPRLQDLELPEFQDGPVLSDILHPEDGSEKPETPFTEGRLAAVDPRYTLGDGTWQTLLRHREKHREAGNGFGYTMADPRGATRTLTARYHKDGQEILVPQDGRNPRRLTPRECSRLMGMPELVMPVSDTRAYRQLGNAVVPPLVEAMAAHLMG